MVVAWGSCRQSQRYPCTRHQISAGRIEENDKSLPNPQEKDVDVDRERLFEGRALSPANFILARVHLVRERHLLCVTFGQESDLVDPVPMYREIASP